MPQTIEELNKSVEGRATISARNDLAAVQFMVRDKDAFNVYGLIIDAETIDRIIEQFNKVYDATRNNTTSLPYWYRKLDTNDIDDIEDITAIIVESIRADRTRRKFMTIFEYNDAIKATTMYLRVETNDIINRYMERMDKEARDAAQMASPMARIHYNFK